MTPSRLWALFALCLAAALAAMGWSSAIVLRLERAEAAARAQGALEENARLALWRVDSTLTSLVARESARPYFHYRPFYPGSRTYTEMFVEPTPGEPLVPSPLLRETPAAIVLHFQIGPGGDLTSPQVPTADALARATAEGLVSATALGERTARLASIRDSVRTVARAMPPQTPSVKMAASVPSPPAARFEYQKQKSAVEYEARQQNLSRMNQSLRVEADEAAPRGVTGGIEEGELAPVWIGDALFLARRVQVNGVRYVQGCWVDWPRLQRELQASVQDLFPNARLEPATERERPDDERRAAALPVRLVTGAVSPPEESVSPVRLSLLGAWVFLLLAAGSIAILLKGVVGLSERRRVFVSAVTHELRTPLTTFRLYTDMLAGGMVEGEARRHEYVARLQAEAERLGHLVENVLFYARLDSERGAATREAVDLAEVVPEIVGRLAERAEKAGLAIVCEPSTEAAPIRTRVDRSALEQILVNLVDNACKYAAASQPALVHVTVQRENRRALIRVRDHGPGFSAAQRRRLFQPFSKSDHEAANSAPGVGLGLALSRRLARAQGGDLSLDTDPGGERGAVFLVSLPLGDAFLGVQG